VPVIGLCHGTFDVSRQLARFTGSPVDETTTLFAGLNHLTFIFDLRRRGVDLWPVARERLSETDADEFAARNPFSWSLFRSYGAYPAANDRHVTEFFPERFPGGAYYGATLGVDAYSFENTIAHGDRIYAEMQEQALGRRPLDERIFARSGGEHEQLLSMLRAIRTDSRAMFAINAPNRGAVPNLPADAVLELPAVATATGLRPVAIPDFPDPLAAIIARRLASVELTVDAALQRDMALFIEALLVDGAIGDPAVARKLAGDLVDAQREHLPDGW
jgi:alpha-galactosidase